MLCTDHGYLAQKGARLRCTLGTQGILERFSTKSLRVSINRSRTPVRQCLSVRVSRCHSVSVSVNQCQSVSVSVSQCQSVSGSQWQSV